MKYAVILCTTVLALPALAHSGHGLDGTHWHASDAWGFVGVAVLAAVAVWLSRGGK
ncbi:MAG: hypothetical protein K2X51_06700 [Burkholderiales bacterium]|jgi:hypothetical protein|nr:hypothetical protein [Burkholderiales bacterium]